MTEKSEASRRATAEAALGRIVRSAKTMIDAEAEERRQQTERLRAERLKMKDGINDGR